MSTSEIGRIEAGGQNAQKSGGLEALIKKLQNDNSPEAKSVKSAYEQLQSDIKSGTADPTTVAKDREALKTAMKAFRETHPHHGHGHKTQESSQQNSFLSDLVKNLQNDQSPEAQKLVSDYKKLQTDSTASTINTSAVTGDRKALLASLNAFIDKQSGLDGSGTAMDTAGQSSDKFASILAKLGHAGASQAGASSVDAGMFVNVQA
jgi:gas vesicle protein